jgi:NAD+ diphosphatase
MNFKPSVIPPDSTCDAYWFLFKNNRIIVQITQNGFTIPRFSKMTEFAPEQELYLGTINSVHCFCAELQEEALPPGFEARELRPLFDSFDQDLFYIATKAMQIVTWYKTHRFCGQCGSQTNRNLHEYSMLCPKCNLAYYPRISPAIIVAITHGDKILLARKPDSTMFSIIAGFVETGETLEETVHRESMEEVNITVKNVTYFASQPWAFSNALMIGFTAEYDSGILKPDGVELEEARWFSASQMPARLPGRISISSMLIEWFLKKSK